ncbi:hypothetical protein D3C79_1116770 [compost metagenome]
MFYGLLQGPVAITDHVAVVGEGEKAGDALGVAQVDSRIGGGKAAEGQGGKAR